MYVYVGDGDKLTSLEWIYFWYIIGERARHYQV